MPFRMGPWEIGLVLVLGWSMALKGVALWRAGRNAHIGWFIALFILHTLGILELIYIFGFSREKK